MLKNVAKCILLRYNQIIENKIEEDYYGRKTKCKGNRKRRKESG